MSLRSNEHCEETQQEQLLPGGRGYGVEDLRWLPHCHTFCNLEACAVVVVAHVGGLKSSFSVMIIGT